MVLAQFEMLRISNCKTGQARFARVPNGKEPKGSALAKASVGAAKPRLERRVIWK
jgi:hypothetical protein